MATTNRRFSQGLIFVFLAIFLIGTISMPVVSANEGAAAVDDGETLDMDTPVKKEEVKAVKAEPVKEVVTKKEEVKEAEVEPVVTAKVVKEEKKVEEKKVEPQVEEKKEEKKVEPQVDENTIESTDLTEESQSRKLSIPFLNKVTKQDAKKIAAFSLGAWGAVTGVGWAMQQFGGDSD